MARKRAENREGLLGFPGVVKPVFTKDSKPPREKEKITRVPRERETRTHLKGSLAAIRVFLETTALSRSNDGLACLDLWCVSLLTLSPTHACTLLPPTILFHTTLGSRLYMRVLARALSPSSIFIMPKKINSFSQTPSSTPVDIHVGLPLLTGLEAESPLSRRYNSQSKHEHSQRGIEQMNIPPPLLGTSKGSLSHILRGILCFPRAFMRLRKEMDRKSTASSGIAQITRSCESSPTSIGPMAGCLKRSESFPNLSSPLSF
ncbi:hypothetical protein TNCV_2525991 [Trichonephila clavipes]|nr:hypothetical protein TNCV_2525991 [Trichonephila clavipes]